MALNQANIFGQRRMQVDGALIEVDVRPVDLLSAERALRRDKIGNPLETAPLETQMRLLFYALTRCQPDHAAAKDWPKFLDMLEDFDTEPEGGEGLDPTLKAD